MHMHKGPGVEVEDEIGIGIGIGIGIWSWKFRVGLTWSGRVGSGLTQPGTAWLQGAEEKQILRRVDEETSSAHTHIHMNCTPQKMFPAHVWSSRHVDIYIYIYIWTYGHVNPQRGANCARAVILIM
jgi:hypothetical protein